MALKYVLAFLACSVWIGALAQVPETISLQGCLTELDGTPVADDTYLLSFKLYDAAETGTIKWSESRNITTHACLYDVQLGESNPISIPLSDPLWLGITPDGEEEMTPRIPLSSVPYALGVRGIRILGGEAGPVSGVSFVAGSNLNQATGIGVTIGGGGGTTSGGNEENSGDGNFVTVSGGTDNWAHGDWTTVGGGRANHATAFQATIGGGWSNAAIGSAGTVGGGWDNTAGSGASSAATVSGGQENSAISDYATVGGGFMNVAEGVGSTVAGGAPSDKVSPGKRNAVFDNWGTIGGGGGNKAGLDDGMENQEFTTISGGKDNSAESPMATVGGGQSNAAGGSASVICGGDSNATNGLSTTIGGGSGNAADADYATVPGGRDNLAGGEYSLAAGRRAKATHMGSFVWADATNADFPASPQSFDNQFLVRAYGGAIFERGRSAVSNTGSALQVEQAHLYEAAWLRQTNAITNANGPAVAALLKPSASTNPFLRGYTQDTDGGAATSKFYINSSGTLVSGSDLAEALPVVGRRADYEPGDVLVISRHHPGAVERSRRPNDPAVIGVFSTRPGVMGADKGGVTEVAPNDVPVAIAGIVPVKASAENGPIRPGDLLVTSGTPGHVMLAQPVTVDGGASVYATGVVVGKALEPIEAGTGIIKMFVMCQ